jgi:hypothetical protein
MQRTQARIVDVELDDLHDEHADKGEFIEMDPSYLTNMFKDLVTEEGYELGAEFDLGETHGADYYAERNPGFPDDWYEILADEHKRLNKEYKDNSILCITNDVSNRDAEQADDCQPEVATCPPTALSENIKDVEPKVEQLVSDPPAIP